MNVLSSHVFAAMLAATAIGVLPKPSYAQAVELVAVDVKAVARGYRASKLRGSNVISEKNEKVGEIDDITSAVATSASSVRLAAVIRGSLVTTRPSARPRQTARTHYQFAKTQKTWGSAMPNLEHGDD
jgi:hypothetical protein